MFGHTYSTKEKEFRKSIINRDFPLFKKMLKSNFLNPTFDSNMPLDYCCGNNLIQYVVELLKDKRIDPSGFNSNCLISAIESGNIDIVKLLNENKKIKLNVLKNKGIYTALINNHLEISIFLLKDYKVDPTEHYTNILTRMSNSISSYKLIDLLIKDIRVNSNQNDILSSLIRFSRGDQIHISLLLFKDKYIQELLKIENISLFKKLHKIEMSNKLNAF